MESIKKGHIFIIVGPSGSGKSTILSRFTKKHPEVRFSSSTATTRKPRENEEDGKDYFFISKPEFEEKIKNDEFIEYITQYDNYYGTLKSPIEKQLSEGRILIKDLDYKGAFAFQKVFPRDKYTIIFIAPPSLEELKKRFEKRATEDEQSIKKRIEKYHKEIEYKNSFDKLIINDDLEKAYLEFENYVLEVLEKIK